MVVSGLCSSCREIAIPGFVYSMPVHCYGTADRPAPEGMLGGFRCGCPCRTWDETNMTAAEFETAFEEGLPVTVVTESPNRG